MMSILAKIVTGKETAQRKADDCNHVNYAHGSALLSSDLALLRRRLFGGLQSSEEGLTAYRLWQAPENSIAGEKASLKKN